MPQVDLVSACAGGSDRKIACETLSDGDAEQPPATAEEQSDPSPDLPPESFWLSQNAEYDWFDRNAYYERKESTKPISHPNSNNSNSNQNSNSQRFSGNLKSKAAIIGLPKTQKASYVDTTKRRNKPPNFRLFPKRNASVGKSMAEPSSPKVSCMGRVRSKRGCRKSSVSATDTLKPVEIARTGRRSIGICGRFLCFRSNRRTKLSITTNSIPPVESPPRSSAREFPVSREFQAKIEPESNAEPPGLGEMKRFVSGRRSWAADDVA
ncbi:hypothetical protein CEY00_Acc16938 [Actinidia chinensis var. chinensis]|uniref:Uncharacterized protein n=2 Tax=Actinidia TaxID=3624 RepID=A0A7J0FX55_9ERIC|nr:hypothetical protein CEY00_Acc16938 [Actinidia chinensis var. chinensis]GFZ02498.1 hypothetical protein Acr_15g0011060 [Actinidia rufa]